MGLSQRSPIFPESKLTSQIIEASSHTVTSYTNSRIHPWAPTHDVHASYFCDGFYVSHGISLPDMGPTCIGNKV